MNKKHFWSTIATATLFIVPLLITMIIKNLLPGLEVSFFLLYVEIQCLVVLAPVALKVAWNTLDEI